MARPPLTTPTPLHRPQLGSGSASRRHVLEKAGVQHRVVKPDIDERAIRHEDPVALVEALARAKADALLARWRGKDADAGPTPDFLITCDQVVVCNGEIQQIFDRFDFTLGEEPYLRIIEAKTAELYAASTELERRFR